VSAYIAAGVLLAARRVCEQAPAARVLVLALTPRGDRGLDWPAKTMHSWPCKRAPQPICAEPQRHQPEHGGGRRARERELARQDDQVDASACARAGAG